MTTRSPASPDASQPPSRFEALRGRAGNGLSTDQIMALTRGGLAKALCPLDGTEMAAYLDGTGI